MARTDADIEAFINGLDTDEAHDLVNLVADMDPLAMKDGKPAFNAEQMNLIQRFQQFVTDYPVEDDVQVDESGLEKETLSDDEDSEDIPGTGETDPDDVSDLVKHDAEAGLPGFTRIQ